MHSPTVVNQTQHSLVVFQERGTLYNKQVLLPGEAVTMTRRQTGGLLLSPYYVHAVIGDDQALPTARDSATNLLKVTAIPAAFVAGCLATAVTAGMLVGPSVALAPLVSGMVLNGVVIDAAAITAGGLLATRAQMVTDFLLKKHPDKFMAKSGRLRPGQRFLIVRGGLEEGPVQIVEVSKREFDKLGISTIKEPINENSKSEDTLQGTSTTEQEEEIGVPAALNEGRTTLVQMS
jgi:hypothetical protein